MSDTAAPAGFTATSATSLLASKGGVPAAAYPTPGSRGFSTELLGCCDVGAPACLSLYCYSLACAPCYFGELYERAGLPYWLGFFCLGNMSQVRTRVRLHYGIGATDCCDLGCGSDCTTLYFCPSCATCQLYNHLRRMEREGAGMSGVPK